MTQRFPRGRDQFEPGASLAAAGGHIRIVFRRRGRGDKGRRDYSATVTATRPTLAQSKHIRLPSMADGTKYAFKTLPCVYSPSILAPTSTCRRMSDASTGHTRESQQEASAEQARRRPDKTKRVPKISANSRGKTPHLPTPLQPADSLGTREVTITHLFTEKYKLEKNASACVNNNHMSALRQRANTLTTQHKQALPYLGFP